MDEDRRTEILEKVRSFKAKFQAYNQARLSVLNASIANPRVIDLLESIPYLLSTNISGLPGFINTERMVGGLHGYVPSGRAVSFLKSEFPVFKMIAGKSPKPFIQMFALMGSGGTIAYTQHSDFDFWICADTSEHEAAVVRLFKLKCRSIENWVAERFGVEVHFFLNDIAKVKSNVFDEDSEMNMEGTSLGELLKEEFFRSSIVMNGKIPFWWVVPEGSSDAVYEEWLSVVKKSAIEQEFIDLGNLSTIEREDFLVGALFQLLKSLGNPFKSIIKLGLLERYIHDSRGTPFISNIIKKNIHEGKLGIDDIDSYVVMFNQVLEFYAIMAKDVAAAEMLKTCFYLKVDPKLSSHPSQAKDGNVHSQVPKVVKMAEYVKNWSWPPQKLAQMDNFENLNIDAVNKLLGETKKYVLKGYKDILSVIDTTKVKRRLGEDEIKGITRRIYSHFSVSENKIDNTLSFKSYPVEKLLHIEFVRDKDGKEYWLLSKRVIVRNFPAKIIIHKEDHLIGIVVWISLNKLYQKDYTRLEIDSGIHAIDANYLRELIPELTLYFSSKRAPLQNSYFIRDAFPVTGCIVVNPYSKYAKRIEEMFFLYHNSWGETRFERYRSESDIAHILAKSLTGGIRTGLDADTALRITSSQPFASSRDFDRLHRVIGNVFSFFIEHNPNLKKRYVTMLGNQYVVFSSKRSAAEASVTAGVFESEIKMLYNLSFNTGVMNATKVDPAVAELSYLRTIVENTKENAVQIYFQVESKYCYFFVSDERGSIFFFRKSADSYMDYLARLYLFADSAVAGVQRSNPASPFAGNLKPVMLFRLERDIKHAVKLSEINPEMDKNIVEARKRIVPTTLQPRVLENGELGYRFTLPDGNYTDAFTKSGIQGIIREIAVLARSVKGYSFYVSGIDLSHIEMKLYRNFTSFAFTEKNMFELLMEKGIQALAAR